LPLALPQIAQWRLAALPKGLAAVEVNTLLGAFDRNTLGGRRDYAIARCYIDLGLRTAEIVRLQLDDIDWREGVLRVRGKGRRTDALPLPATTGSAIADYLHDARVNTDNRTLFQRLHAPHDKPIVADTVRGAMRNAAKRCGLSAQLSGPHRLRHTLAIQLVHNGASVKAIADVLRHRSLDTTTIYAKVDLKALSRVAAVWPGSRS
jgi:integrase/recombinase XerD